MRWRRAFCAASVLVELIVPARGEARQPVDTLTLSAAVRAALETHPALALPSAERDRSAAIVGEVRATRFPRVTTEWLGVRHQEPMIVAPLHGFDPRTPPDFNRTLVQGNLAVSWMLFDGGARGARIARAEAVAAAAEASVDVARAELITRAARAYLSVAGARETTAALRAQVATLDAERTRVLRFEAEGRVARVAVLRAEAALSRAQADLAAQRARLREAESDLARLVTLRAERIAALTLVAPEARFEPPRPRDELLALARATNDEVARARRHVEAAQSAVAEARATFLPTVLVAGRYNAFGSAGGDATAEWQGGVQLSWPVFTSGQRTNGVARATAELAAAGHALRLAELEVEAAVDHALTALAEADARVAALDAAVAQYEAVLDVERLALEAGAGVQTDFLAAEAALFDARSARTSAAYAGQLARIELARATGELTLDWLDSNLVRSR